MTLHQFKTALTYLEAERVSVSTRNGQYQGKIRDIDEFASLVVVVSALGRVQVVDLGSIDAVEDD